MDYKAYITTPIVPKNLEIFYEDETPYLKYTGIAKDSNGITYEVSIPKMSLILTDVHCKSESRYEDYGFPVYNSFLAAVTHKVHAVSDELFTIKPIERTCTKEDLEKELGYKLTIEESKPHRCSCWEYDRNQNRGVCMGTKEREVCSCDGYQSRCDFYPEKRK